MRKLSLGLLLALTACTTTPTPTSHVDIASWADDHYLYFRFRMENQTAALQGNATPVAIQLDADGNKSTGLTSKFETFNTLGLDLEIEFSPAKDGKPGKGVAIRRMNADGTTTAIPTADTGLTISPTSASDWFEARLSRDLWPALGLPENPPAVRGVFVSKTTSGKIDGYSDAFSVALPPHAATQLADLDIPAKPEKSFRILTYNVEKSAPLKNPAAFGRLVFIADPDAVVLQEVADGDAAKWTSWFNIHASRGQAWHLHKTEKGDVLIASRLPLEPFANDDLEMPGENNKPRSVRFLAAKVETPTGPQVVATLHLKCCGTLDSREDHLRHDEALAINNALTTELAKSRDPKTQATLPVIIAGDFNLVGDPNILTLAGRGLDTDGGDLTPAQPDILGDTVQTTWIDYTTEFSPSRLDYVLYGPKSAAVAQSYVIDTQRLTDRVLHRAGLDREDSRASDHMPVIVDLTPAR